MTNYLKVTKKPVYEDAVQFRHDLPKSWNLCKTFVGAKWSQTRNAGFVNTAYVETPEGRTALVDGDYIVHGLNKGDFFVLSEVQFHESYDIIASMRKWEPKKGILDDKDPWEDITHIDQMYPTDLLKMMLPPTQRTVTFNDEKVGRMEGKYHDGVVDSMAGSFIGSDLAVETMKGINKKLSTPMDHILSDLRYQAAMAHETTMREKVRKDDKTKTDG